MANSQHTFVARGSQLTRCEQCLQAQFNCLCPWQCTLASPIDFVLLMHPKEPYKPSNTGRLIAELLPHNTTAFLWSRTDIPIALTALLNDPGRALYLLFPDKDHRGNMIDAHALPPSDHTNKRLTIILLDGTWKQAARMAKLSPYLQALPKISLDNPQALTHNTAQNTVKNINENQRQPYVRIAQETHQGSTAEAAACLLEQIGEHPQALALYHYATLLNHHTRATRQTMRATMTTSHHYLATAKQRLNENTP